MPRHGVGVGGPRCPLSACADTAGPGVPAARYAWEPVGLCPTYGHERQVTQGPGAPAARTCTRYLRSSVMIMTKDKCSLKNSIVPVREAPPAVNVPGKVTWAGSALQRAPQHTPAGEGKESASSSNVSPRLQGRKRRRGAGVECASRGCAPLGLEEKGVIGVCYRVPNLVCRVG